MAAYFASDSSLLALGTAFAPLELERPATLNLTRGGALAVLVDARAGQVLDDDVHERNWIPHQINRCPLGPVERIRERYRAWADSGRPVARLAQVTVDELEHRLAEEPGLRVLDVRRPGEYVLSSFFATTPSSPFFAVASTSARPSPRW